MFCAGFAASSWLRNTSSPELNVGVTRNLAFRSEIFNDFDLNSYTALVRASVLASGLIFELPILVYFLTKIGLITPELMRKYRKIALVLVMFLSAVITPPDIASQIIVAIPVLILYELSIFISKRVVRNLNKKS